MKSKNIPADIRKKTIKEAQSEIKDIIEKFESTKTNLEESIEQYNRMMQLNSHIQTKFSEKSSQIKKSFFLKRKKKPVNKLK